MSRDFEEAIEKDAYEDVEYSAPAYEIDLAREVAFTEVYDY